MSNMDDLEKRVQLLENIIHQLVASNRYTFLRDTEYFDGRNLKFGKNVGTRIGTETTQKLGFWGKTPIVQRTAILNPSGGSTVDTQARSTIANIINFFTTIGLTG